MHMNVGCDVINSFSLSDDFSLRVSTPSYLYFLCRTLQVRVCFTVYFLSCDVRLYFRLIENVAGSRIC